MQTENVDFVIYDTRKKFCATEQTLGIKQIDLIRIFCKAIELIENKNCENCQQGICKAVSYLHKKSFESDKYFWTELILKNLIQVELITEIQADQLRYWIKKQILFKEVPEPEFAIYKFLKIKFN